MTSTPSQSDRRAPVYVLGVRVSFVWVVGFRALMWLSLILAGKWALDRGTVLRRWAWDVTEDTHFSKSLRNAIEWGSYANRMGILNVYPELVKQYGEAGEFSGHNIDNPGQPVGEFALDYPPLRLQIAARWAAVAAVEEFKRYHAAELKSDPSLPIPPSGKLPPPNWQPSYEFNRPMLDLNQGCEIAAAFAMFLLVHYWIWRCGRAPGRRRWWFLGKWISWTAPLADDSVTPLVPVSAELPRWLPRLAKPLYDYCASCDWLCLRGAFAGFAAAILLWFNPAIIYNAHCFPQWDTWVLPFFILAVYCALREWWVAAGLLVGFEAMNKGQILLVAPALLLWPLLRFRIGSLLAAVIGFALGVVLVARPWMMINPDAQVWAGQAIWALPVLAPLFLLRHRGKALAIIRRGLGVAGVLVILHPWLRQWNPKVLYVIATGTVVFWLLAHLIPWRTIPRWCVALLSAVTALMVTLMITRVWRGPWNEVAQCIIGLVAVMALLGESYLPWRSMPRWIAIGPAVVVGLSLVLLLPPLFVRPWVKPWNSQTLYVIAGFAAILWLGARFLSWRWIFGWASAGVAGGVSLCVPLFNGNMDWYTVGILYGTRHWKHLFWCKGANLGALLENVYDWRYPSPESPPFMTSVKLADYLPLDILNGFNHFVHARSWLSWMELPDLVPMRTLMITAYLLTLVPCAIAIARHARWHDRRFLFAMVAPWVLMFALLPQMQDRYLVWAVGVSAAIAAISVEGLLLHIALTLMCWIMMANWVLEFGEARFSVLSREWLPITRPFHPGLGWASIFLAFVSLYMALVRTRKPRLTRAEPDCNSAEPNASAAIPAAV